MCTKVVIEEMQVCTLAIAKFACGAQHQFTVIGRSRKFRSIPHWRKTHANFGVTKRCAGGIDRVQQESQAILNASAPRVGACIQRARKKLIDQVRVRAMHLNSVESSGLGVRGCNFVVTNNAGHFIGFQGTRHAGWHLFKSAVGTDNHHLGRRGRGNARHRRLPVWLMCRVTDAPDMPELQEDSPARRMHTIGHDLPTSHLRGTVNPGSVRIALALRRDLRGLRNQQAIGGALRVVHCLQLARNAIRVLGALASKRSHEYAVGTKKSAQVNRLNQWVHVLAHVGLKAYGEMRESAQAASRISSYFGNF